MQDQSALTEEASGDEPSYLQRRRKGLRSTSTYSIKAPELKREQKSKDRKGLWQQEFSCKSVQLKWTKYLMFAFQVLLFYQAEEKKTVQFVKYKVVVYYYKLIYQSGGTLLFCFLSFYTDKRFSQRVQSFLTSFLENNTHTCFTTLSTHPRPDQIESYWEWTIYFDTRNFKAEDLKEST